MGDIGEQECAGCGDGTRCPKEGVPAAGCPVYLCENCEEERVLRETELGRWPAEDDGPTPPVGDPGEAGHGTAA